jgi:two-component system, sensor histidine kinase RegB
MIAPSAHHDRSLLRLQTIVRLRWVAVAGQAVTVAVVFWALEYEFPVTECLAIIVLSALSNLALQTGFPESKRLDRSFATMMLGYDILQLSALLYLTGGLLNPFAPLLAVPVVVSASSLPLSITALIAGFAVVSASLLTRYHFPLPWRAGETLNFPFAYLAGVWLAIVCQILFMAVYAWRIARETREMSQALTATELVLAREQRLAALDGLAAAAAHELGTPLATITVVAKELEREISPDSPVYDDVLLLGSQARRCREILTTLTRHSGETDAMFSNTRLRHLIEEVVDPHRLTGVEIAVTLACAQRINDKASASDKSGSGGGKSTAERDPLLPRNPGILYGLGNIVENAVDFAKEKVEIVAEWDQDQIMITITDDGPGFPPGVLGRLGEPYVTTRPASMQDDEQHGMGLGFFIAKTLLERTGATIKLSNSAATGGAVVQIRWPRATIEQKVSHAHGLA